MKNIPTFILMSLALFSCSSKKNKSTISDTNSQSQKSTGNPFFDYDEIVYHFNNFDNSKLEELSNNRLKSEIDSVKNGVILGNIPNNISDTSFIASLEKMGYTKSTINKSKFPGIDKIFIEKRTTERVFTPCEYIYRDILIFKKLNKIIGTAKICLGCMDNQIKGTIANTENFGQDGDYKQLEKLLHQ